MRKLNLAWLLILLLRSASWAGDDASPIHTVLVIYSNDRLTPADAEVESGLRQALAASSLHLAYLAEFLGAPRFDDAAYDKLVSDFLRAKYAHHPIDVIVAAGPDAFYFLRRHQSDLFSAKPVVVFS